ncbi:hypothetical protein L7F22_012652 [Adiantum nelumboides]|nr:hypothetical protein [Adiantum nelumboides]
MFTPRMPSVSFQTLAQVPSGVGSAPYANAVGGSEGAKAGTIFATGTMRMIMQRPELNSKPLTRQSQTLFWGTPQGSSWYTEVAQNVSFLASYPEKMVIFPVTTKTLLDRSSSGGIFSNNLETITDVAPPAKLTWTAFLWVKVDLNAYKNYDELISTLEGMFYSPPVGEGVRFLHARDFVLTYEDKEGDWMLVGDVPWGMFVNTVKRLRITRGSDSTCLGPSRRIYLPEGLLDIPEKFLENSSYGFDPFGLSKKAVDFDKYQAYELIHARWAMLGAVGFVILEALNKYGTSSGTEAVWFQDMLMSFMLDDIVGGCNDGDLELLLFISFSNLEDIDFSTAAAMNPIQAAAMNPIQELGENLQGTLEYQTRYAKFQNVASLILQFPENFGAQTIRISFIGLQGEATQLKRDAVANIVYEALPNPTEHRVPIENNVPTSCKIVHVSMLIQ